MKEVEVQSQKFKLSGLALPVKSEVAGNYLQKLYEDNDKQLTADLVVAKSKAKSSPLHKCFEWNDKKAGGKWRVHQARNIINCVSVVKDVNGEDKEVKAFVNIQFDSEGQLSNDSFSNSKSGSSFYVSIDDAMANPNSRNYTLDMAIRELDSFTRKYESLVELADLFKFISTNKSLKKKRKVA